MLTEDQTRDIDFCKNFLIKEISHIEEDYEKLKDKLTGETMVSIIYLKIFSAYTKEQKITTLEESFKFMNDMKGIVEKISYVNSYFKRVKDHLKIS